MNNNALRYFTSWLLYQTGVTTLSRRLLCRDCCFVLLFHGISSQRYLAVPDDVQPSLSRDELRTILSWLQPRFRFLSPTEFFAADHPGVLLTFDDGLANNVTNALPVLEEYNAPAIFFVSTQHVLEPRNWLSATRQMARRGWGSEDAVPEDIALDYYDGMSADQLVRCAAHPLITIGSHTVSHSFLTRCSIDELSFELTESKRALEAMSGKTVDLFAYPTGDYNREVAEAVQAAGYRAAFAVAPRNVGLPGFEIPRIGIYQPEPPYLSLKLSGLYRCPIKNQPVYLTPDTRYLTSDSQ